MPRRPSLDAATQALIDELEPHLRDAFLSAIDDIRDGVNEQALRDALAKGDIEAAIEALDLTPASFNKYAEARRAAFGEGGALSAGYIPTGDTGVVQFRFDMTNPAAEAWIREASSTRITGYLQEQVEIARSVIAAGYGEGRGPIDIAASIAGRYDRASGKRTGGIIGLSAPQSRYVESMRARLESGDPAEMRKVLSEMTLRDKRYDGRIRDAIEKGKPLSKADTALMTQRYADRLLKRRAEDIARTETSEAVYAARHESFRQVINKAGLAPDAVSKEWLHNGGTEDARMQHIMMNNRSVVGIEAAFIMQDGTKMLHAHDPSGGAAHNVNCRCGTNYKINYSRKRNRS